MEVGTMNIKLIISAQVGDDEPIQVGETILPLDLEVVPTVQVETAGAYAQVTITGAGSDRIEQAIRAALCDCQPCANHKPVQHRDGRPPWCNACGE